MKLRKISLFLILFWLILAGLIVWFKVVPFGKSTYRLSYPTKVNILGGKGFIGRLTPAERVNNFPGEMPEIIGDPVYFSVFTPRTFNEAKITITYQDNLSSSTPIIEAGVLVDNIVWRYKLVSLENKILDNNFSTWTRLQEGNTLLLQKNKKFSNVADFLSATEAENNKLCGNKETIDCVALYNTVIKNKFNLKNNLEFAPIKTPLQGTHQFYLFTDNYKDWEFVVDFADLNFDRKPDPVIISLYSGDNKVYSRTIADNFEDDGSGIVRNFNDRFSYKLNIQNKDESNLYKLEIKTSDDVVIKKIIKAPSALNIIGRLRPVMVDDLPLSLWTDSSFIKLTTNNPASRQKIKFGDQFFSLSDPYQQYEFYSNKNGLKKIILNKDDVILETDGVFSFSSDNFFNPDFKKVDEHFNLNDNLKYVLANYQTPKSLNGNIKQATVTLETKEAYRENGKYSFMISVPGLSLSNYGNAKQDSILIKDIKIEFFGRNIIDKIKEYVN